MAETQIYTFKTVSVNYIFSKRDPGSAPRLGPISALAQPRLGFPGLAPPARLPRLGCPGLAPQARLPRLGSLGLAPLARLPRLVSPGWAPLTGLPWLGPPGLVPPTWLPWLGSPGSALPARPELSPGPAPRPGQMVPNGFK